MVVVVVGAEVAPVLVCGTVPVPVELVELVFGALYCLQSITTYSGATFRLRRPRFFEFLDELAQRRLLLVAVSCCLIEASDCRASAACRASSS